MSVTATAHPNIALIKYWGKRSVAQNIPATPSLSITLDELTTTTTVREAHSERDHIQLDGSARQDKKIENWLNELRVEFEFPPLDIRSHNNFPTASGLASSASGFAALITAINQFCELGLDATARSDWARRGSASAARSIFGDWVTLNEPDWTAAPMSLHKPWPLEVVVAITDLTPKSVSSSVGMQQSAESPFFEHWVSSTKTDFAEAQTLVAEHNFDALAELAEHSCLKMHGLMLSTTPGLVYWQPATLAAIHRIRQLRAEGYPVFFTIDAGPQVKAVCEPGATDAVAQTLGDIPGVQQVLRTKLGPGAQCLP